MENVFDELKWRGLVAQTTDEHSLREAFNSPLTSYCGFDPTAASLHGPSFTDHYASKATKSWAPRAVFGWWSNGNDWRSAPYSGTNLED